MKKPWRRSKERTLTNNTEYDEVECVSKNSQLLQAVNTISNRLRKLDHHGLIGIASSPELELAIKSWEPDEITVAWEQAAMRTPAVLEVLAEVPIGRDAVHLLFDLLTEELTARILTGPRGQTTGQVSMISTVRIDQQQEVIAI